METQVTSPAVVVGSRFTLFLDTTGCVWGMGSNNMGQLGLGDFDERSTVTSVPRNSFPAPVIAIAAGVNHSLFLISSGAVFATGDNSNGQLGIGTPNVWDNFHTPAKVQVPPVKSIYCGSYFSHFIDREGQLWGCGDNTYGQLGILNASLTHRQTPTKIPKLSGIIKICGGANHTLFLDGSGDVWKAGSGLFDGSNNTQELRLRRLSIHGPIKSIAVGHFHNLFLRIDGTVLAYGNNQKGQLGFDVQTRWSLAPEVIRGLPPIARIYAGNFQSFFIDLNGQIWGCGRSINGQLGIEAPTKGAVFLTKLPFSTNEECTIVSGDAHTILIEGNKVWGAGSNFNHQLGNFEDEQINEFTPLAEVVLDPTTAVAVKSARTA